jgi:hypothetical protein
VAVAIADGSVAGYFGVIGNPREDVELRIAITACLKALRRFRLAKDRRLVAGSKNPRVVGHVDEEGDVAAFGDRKFRERLVSGDNVVLRATNGGGGQKQCSTKAKSR